MCCQFDSRDHLSRDFIIQLPLKGCSVNGFDGEALYLSSRHQPNDLFLQLLHAGASPATIRGVMVKVIQAEFSEESLVELLDACISAGAGTENAETQDNTNTNPVLLALQHYPCGLLVARKLLASGLRMPRIMSATLHEDTGEEVIPPLVRSIHHPGRLSVSVIGELMQYHECESSKSIMHE